MLTYTIIDWVFTVSCLILTIILGIYWGAACICGILAYFLYPVLIEPLYNLLSKSEQLRITQSPTMPIVYSDDYNITACGIEKMHPFDSCKYGRVFRDLLRHYPHLQAFNPKLVSRALLIELGMSKWYLFKMSYSMFTSTLIELPLFFLPGAFLRQCLLDRMLLATSGSLYGAVLALEKGWAINLSGGYHHASLNTGGGQHYITLVVNYLKMYHSIQKIMVIDLDAHQGNGYQRDFLDRSITIVDFYNSFIYPGDHVAAKAITKFQHVDKDTSDEEYLYQLKEALSKPYNADFVIYNAGTDVMAGDPLGGCYLSPECIKRRDEIVFRFAREKRVPILMLLSGGYQKENTYIIMNQYYNQQTMSENGDIIQFDDGDNEPRQMNNFQEDDYMHEPGMGHINKQADNLPQLERPKTAAYQMEVRQKQQQQQQQQQYQQYQQPVQEIHKQQQSDESVSDTDNRNEVNQSIVNFQSEYGDNPGELDENHQQVQPNMLSLQPVNDAENNDQQLQQQPLASQVRQSVNPFPPKIDIAYLKQQLENNEVRKNFLTTPLQKGYTLQCSIRRDKSGLARLYPVYHVYSTEGELYLFSAKKVVMNTTSNYVISMDKKEFSTRKSAFLGKVRSNFLGTEFMLWDEGKNFKKCRDTSQIRTQLGVVYYESHIMQNKGPRKMKVLLPKVSENNIPKVFQPLHSMEGLQYDYQNNKRDYIEEFINKPPRWDSKMKAHVLNFYGRVDQPSVKNFQLVKPTDHNYIYLQFGRVDDLLFNLDFCWPITPLQAFQVCVTSFDFKFACE